MQSRGGNGWPTAGDVSNLRWGVPLFVLRVRVYVCVMHPFCFYGPFRGVAFVLLLILCPCWSLIGVPLIFSCPADHVPDWQPRILLGVVEARSVNAKNTRIHAHTNTHTHAHTGAGTETRAVAEMRTGTRMETETGTGTGSRRAEEM